MRNTFFSVCTLVFGLSFQAAAASLPMGPTLYVAPDSGFEVNIVAALQKKHVPVQVVTEANEAEYVLRPSPVEIHKESGASKVARCLFAYCMGIEDSGEVSVQLVERESHRVVWAYEVAKQRAVKNRQSMAEAIAKHLNNEFLERSR